MFLVREVAHWDKGEGEKEVISSVYRHSVLLLLLRHDGAGLPRHISVVSAGGAILFVGLVLALVRHTMISGHRPDVIVLTFFIPVALAFIWGGARACTGVALISASADVLIMLFAAVLGGIPVWLGLSFDMWQVVAIIALYWRMFGDEV